MKFSTNGEINYNGKVVSTDITFDATKDIEGKMTLRTPISDDMIVLRECYNYVFRNRSL
jgi:hypothetical protein